MKYSLANYIVSIESNDADIKGIMNDSPISIGGEGSYMGSVTVSRKNPLYETTAYKTGAWIHNKNLDRTGTVTISINQLANQVGKFIQLANTFYASDYEGFTVSISNINGEKVATCIDCYFTKIPDQAFGENAAEQDWELTCGQVNFNA